MNVFGVFVSTPVAIAAIAIIIILAILIVLAIISSKKSGNQAEIEDYDKRTEFGDFHGLLTKEDFENRCEDHMLEVYRMQWIQAAPGDEKDNYLLLYLALKQLNKEQDESAEEWTQEQCEARMDEIIADLSKKTGIKLIMNDISDEDCDDFATDVDSEDTPDGDI